MRSRDVLYVIMLAIFSMAFLSINPYPIEFIAVAIILFAISAIMKNKKES